MEGARLRPEDRWSGLLQIERVALDMMRAIERHNFGEGQPETLSVGNAGDQTPLGDPSSLGRGGALRGARRAAGAGRGAAVRGRGTGTFVRGRGRGSAMRGGLPLGRGGAGRGGLPVGRGTVTQGQSGASGFGLPYLGGGTSTGERLREGNRQDSIHAHPEPLRGANQEAEESTGNCVVCQDQQATMAVVDCGHLALCQPCSDAIMRSTRKCPICRTSIVMPRGLIRIYRP